MTQLPKDALHRVIVGQSFAEFDILRDDPHLFVVTPASLAADNPEAKKLVFVGRRGAGKTAIAIHLARKSARVVNVLPQSFNLIKLPLSYESFHDTRQRPFKSLVSAFERALLHELVRHWLKAKCFSFERTTPDVLCKERNLIENCDFDTGVISITEEIFAAYANENQKFWLRQIKRSEELNDAINSLRANSSSDFTFLIDRIDDAWDGTDCSIIALMALMHASIRLVSVNKCIRPLIFVRENIYERIRQSDNEFSRIETAVTQLEWTIPKLQELLERRLVRPFNTKPSLNGEAWRNFFEETSEWSSGTEMFKICQPRPRDVLMFGTFAIESAVANGRQKIGRTDILAAQERYSSSRLKDLADEFDENYPNIQIILGYYYGLSTGYTISAIEDFIQKLLTERPIHNHCKWFYTCTTSSMFIDLLYKIGFVGIQTGSRIRFRGSASDEGFTTKIEHTSIVVIHPTYHAALRLRPIVLNGLNDDVILKTHGILDELPAGVSFDTYKEKVSGVLKNLQECPLGDDGAARFEELVGEIIQLCFFRALTNVQPKVRSSDNRTCKDWIATNSASDGFWEMIRNKYGSVQIVWECKNYTDLSASDFHQVSYYINDVIGRFAIIAFRGDTISDASVGHIRRIANDKGMVVILRQRDLETFLRQALNGKVKETHLTELYSKMVRAVS